ALDVDAPGAPRSLLAGEASELDEVRACGARRWSGSGRSARRARVLRSVLHRRGSGRCRRRSESALEAARRLILDGDLASGRGRLGRRSSGGGERRKLGGGARRGCGSARFGRKLLEARRVGERELDGLAGVADTG